MWKILLEWWSGVTNFLQGYADAGFNKYKDFGLDTQLVLEDLTF